MRPHERTLAGPKADRLKVLRAARANLSSVFLLYEDREDELGPLLAPAFEERPVAAVATRRGRPTRSRGSTDPAADRGDPRLHGRRARS